MGDIAQAAALTDALDQVFGGYLPTKPSPGLPQKRAGGFFAARAGGREFPRRSKLTPVALPVDNSPPGHSPTHYGRSHNAIDAGFGSRRGNGRMGGVSIGINGMYMQIDNDFIHEC